MLHTAIRPAFGDSIRPIKSLSGRSPHVRCGDRSRSQLIQTQYTSDPLQSQRPISPASDRQVGGRKRGARYGLGEVEEESRW